LRSDNADERLYNYGTKFGLIPRVNRQKINLKLRKIKELIQFCKETIINPNIKINSFLESVGSTKIMTPTSIYSLIKRPEIDLEEIIASNLIDVGKMEYLIDVIIRIKYEGYIKKETETAKDLIKYDKFTIPQEINYQEVNNLSNEAVEKLMKIKPVSIGQASRIL
jgi:tRNA uridine 5-carboxymethylaminomethyl modification enzyme